MKQPLYPVFSIDFKKLANYKTLLDIETRILFELLVRENFNSDIDENKRKFFVDKDQIYRDYGIHPFETDRVIRWLAMKGYVCEMTEQFREKDNIYECTYVYFDRSNVLEAAKEIMYDSALFIEEFETFLKIKDSEVKSE